MALASAGPGHGPDLAHVIRDTLGPFLKSRRENLRPLGLIFFDSNKTDFYEEIADVAWDDLPKKVEDSLIRVECFDHIPSTGPRTHCFSVSGKMKRSPVEGALVQEWLYGDDDTAPEIALLTVEPGDSDLGHVADFIMSLDNSFGGSFVNRQTSFFMSLFTRTGKTIRFVPVDQSRLKKLPRHKLIGFLKTLRSSASADVL